MLGGETLNELRKFVRRSRTGKIWRCQSSSLTFDSDLQMLVPCFRMPDFSLPCVDTETVHVGYADAVSVWEHLQHTGDTNASLGRLTSKPSVDTLLAAASVYQSAFYVEGLQEEEDDEDEGYLPATFQVVYLIGWKVDKSQAGPISKPLLRGSASLHLSELSSSDDDDSENLKK